MSHGRDDSDVGAERPASGKARPCSRTLERVEIFGLRPFPVGRPGMLVGDIDGLCRPHTFFFCFLLVSASSLLHFIIRAPSALVALHLKALSFASIDEHSSTCQERSPKRCRQRASSLALPMETVPSWNSIELQISSAARKSVLSCALRRAPREERLVETWHEGSKCKAEYVRVSM